MSPLLNIHSQPFLIAKFATMKTVQYSAIAYLVAQAGTRLYNHFASRNGRSECDSWKISKRIAAGTAMVTMVILGIVPLTLSAISRHFAGPPIIPDGLYN
jgi:hypothetical protein